MDKKTSEIQQNIDGIITKREFTTNGGKTTITTEYKPSTNYETIYWETLSEEQAKYIQYLNERIHELHEKKAKQEEVIDKIEEECKKPFELHKHNKIGQASGVMNARVILDMIKEYEDE